jgi:hypothetical protein
MQISEQKSVATLTQERIAADNKILEHFYQQIKREFIDLLTINTELGFKCCEILLFRRDINTFLTMNANVFAGKDKETNTICCKANKLDKIIEHVNIRAGILINFEIENAKLFFENGVTNIIEFLEKVYIKEFNKNTIEFITKETKKRTDNTNINTNIVIEYCTNTLRKELPKLLHDFSVMSENNFKQYKSISDAIIDIYLTTHADYDDSFAKISKLVNFRDPDLGKNKLHKATQTEFKTTNACSLPDHLTYPLLSVFDPNLQKIITVCPCQTIECSSCYNKDGTLSRSSGTLSHSSSTFCKICQGYGYILRNN